MQKNLKKKNNIKICRKLQKYSKTIMKNGCKIYKKKNMYAFSKTHTFHLKR